MNYCKTITAAAVANAAETLTETEVLYLAKKVEFEINTRRAAVALEQGDTNAHFAHHRAAGCAKYGVGFFGRTLSTKRKAELGKMGKAIGAANFPA